MDEATRALMKLDDETRRSMASTFLDGLIEECLLEAVFEEHRSYKLMTGVCQACKRRWGEGGLYGGATMHMGGNGASNANRDIFNQDPSFTGGEKFQCPSCKTDLPAARFASHLGNCLGIGRTGGRSTTRRTASQVGTPIGNDSDTEGVADGKKREFFSFLQLSLALFPSLFGDGRGRVVWWESLFTQFFDRRDESKTKYRHPDPHPDPNPLPGLPLR
ncbi:hypothetical protein BDK51DRAFT_39622 [Blyttiomyces helicus]|uniref:SAGA-associated factor 11 n=1 Tax=Blyttiomyces helicus TaxID=388810 RepID=A0A4P9VZ27_9FUNG|nr:hypothetical protein BDK51DRAFT_39622 [Blyttiomyces helicus]|eukprot:RKO84235.1 hypothetical protein BDK51DRAFT_39622 [Blyttiomyces helicus]